MTTALTPLLSVTRSAGPRTPGEWAPPALHDRQGPRSGEVVTACHFDGRGEKRSGSVEAALITGPAFPGSGHRHAQNERNESERNVRIGPRWPGRGEHFCHAADVPFPRIIETRIRSASEFMPPWARLIGMPLRPMLHPYLHWTDTSGHTARGRTKVMMLEDAPEPLTMLNGGGYRRG
jgi:hypothetical protein